MRSGRSSIRSYLKDLVDSMVNWRVREAEEVEIVLVSRDVKEPGVYEVPMGTRFEELVLEHAGGPKTGRALKALFSGVSNPVLLPTALSARLDFGSMQKIGSGLGSGGFVVYDDTACTVRVAHKFSEFLYVESCGQCTPCKFGTNEATYFLHKLVHGVGDQSDLAHALEGAAIAPHANRCYLAVEHSLLIPSIVSNFAAEFEQHFHRGCRSSRDIVVPKIVDFDPAKHSFTYFRDKRMTP